MSDNPSQRPLPGLTPVVNNIPPEVPSLYFNGFDIRLGLGDVNITLFNRGVPLVVLESSFTMTKSLAESLGTLIAQLEQITGNQIMTSSFVEEKLKGVFDENQPSS